MKKYKTKFKKVFNFFDRRIVMPMTRLVYKITKQTSMPNKKFESWLSKSSTLLFVSLFLSIIIFIVVDRKIIDFSNQSAEILKAQEVNVVYSEEQYVVEGLPETVDVTLIGSKADLYIAKQSSISGVTVDLTGLTPGTHKVNIEYDHGSSIIEYSVNPSVATVIIYKKVSDTRSITYDIINSDKLDNTFIVSDVKLSDDKVTIRGAEYKINQVATVKALIDINELSSKDEGTHELEQVTLKAYDTLGNVVDVEFVPESISATMKLTSPSKVVPLNFIPDGSLSTGKSIGSYAFSKNEVTIYGDNDVIASINSIDVKVDVSNLKNDTSFKVKIDKPSKVKSMSENYVTVSLVVTDTSSEPIKFSVPLTGINIGDGLIAQPLDSDSGFITVEVQGSDSILDSIDESDITAYVDLKELSEGTYTKTVVVKGSNPLATYKAKRTEATVVISRKN